MKDTAYEKREFGLKIRAVELDKEKSSSHKAEYQKIEGSNFYHQCPHCGAAALRPQMGCIICDSCGYSRCD